MHFQILGILQTNHVPVKTPYAEVQALFPSISLASHSCIPNTRMYWEVNKLYIFWRYKFYIYCELFDTNLPQ